VLELEPEIKAWAERFADKQHALFLGRGHALPDRLEGALKLKEISYIHAEAYPAGELKHGPLALVDKDMPVIAVAPNDELLEKLKSNLQEVRRAAASSTSSPTPAARSPESKACTSCTCPSTTACCHPCCTSIPLQLLSYHARW
jgi:glucosamine--fructose-6-phosphate aminotransferase (isomerizing)